MVRRILLIVIALIGLSSLPAAAQENLTTTEQAALDEIRFALQHHAATDGFTATVTQAMQQTYFETDQGRTHELRHIRVTEGALTFAAMPDSHYNHQQFDLERTSQSFDQGIRVSDPITIRFQMDVKDDQVLLNVEDAAGPYDLFPDNWTDLPADVEQWPTLMLLDVDDITGLSSVLDPASLDAANIRAVEVLDPVDFEGRQLNRYRVELVPQLVRDAFHPRSFAGMFALNAPFNLTGYVDHISDDEETHFVTEFAIYADDQTLCSYSEQATADIIIPAELVTTELLPDAERRVIVELIEQVTSCDYEE